MTKKALFLSHASVDKEAYVRPMARALRAEGISYWLDEAEIHWGDRIGARINEGLASAEIVVVFLSEAFVGRNWPEVELFAALSRENVEGKTVVLPLMIGDPSEVLAKYPLLRDKAYRSWKDDDKEIRGLVSELRARLFASRVQPTVSAAIHGTPHTVQVRPDLLMDYLLDLDSHTVYDPAVVSARLSGIGFLTSWEPADHELVVNGQAHTLATPDWGKPGVWSHSLAHGIYRLIVGADFSSSYFGRGKQYRELLDSLRAFLERPLGENRTS